MKTLLPGEALEQLAYVTLDGYAGRIAVPVMVLLMGSTPKKHRVRVLENAYGWRKGEVRLVTKQHVRFSEAEAVTTMGKPKVFQVTAEITISIHVSVLANSAADAKRKAADCALPSLHEIPLYEDFADPEYEPEWRTSGELDGTPKIIEVGEVKP